MLIKRKWYRWLRVQLGARSFVKYDEESNADTWVIVTGSWKPDTIAYFRDNEYNEEWEKFPDDPSSND